MSEAASKQEASTSTASNDSNSGPKSIRTINKKISERQSKELVIGLCGPIGSGIQDVSLQLKTVLKDEGYEVFEIRISEAIKNFCKNAHPELTILDSNRHERYQSLMNAGNRLREEHGNEICANLAINEIAHKRDAASKGKPGKKTIADSKEVGLTKRAYIINQLKHPSELETLQQVYRSIFYLVGVLCDEKRRETSLTSEGIDRNEAHHLIQRDKKENTQHGQQLEKTLFDADFFINNTDPNSSSVAALFSRFMKLIHGGRGVTPTQQELGMYAAYSASMQSACLSRQVGAAILNPDGTILATGRNDVPKFGGGLYSEDDHVSPNSKDYRCIHKGQRCYNDQHKLLLKTKIRELLSEKIKDPIQATQLSEDIYNGTAIKSLIEYSRAIHAEMDALISICRSNKSIPKGAIMYTTTYPCHNCARHIIAAGIERIVYIEPYEKSLALKLHDDALCHSDNNRKVQLVPFQGIAPSRYQLFFSNTSPAKDHDGRIIQTDRSEQAHVDGEFVDSYIEQETAISDAVLACQE